MYKTVNDENENVIYTNEPVTCSGCDGRIRRNVFIFENGRMYCNKCLRKKYMYAIKEDFNEVSDSHMS